MTTRHRPARSQRGRGLGILALGTSTGGPNALAALLPALRHPIPVPIVIVQHMPEMFTRLLAERLSNAARFPVHEATGGEALHPGAAWLAPGGYHLEVDDSDGTPRTRLHEGPPEHSCRPAVDVLFRSVARVYGARSLAVVLTGMGQDGLDGSGEIVRAGGEVLVQDEATSVIWGMPGAIARAGYASKVLPLADLASEMDRLCHGTRPTLLRSR
jgi:two-component system chemotaxis response regulator CheB